MLAVTVYLNKWYDIVQYTFHCRVIELQFERADKEEDTIFTLTVLL